MFTGTESAPQSQGLTVPQSGVISIQRKVEASCYTNASLRTLCKRLRYGGKKGRSARKRLKKGVVCFSPINEATEYRLITARTDYDRWEMRAVTYG